VSWRQPRSLQIRQLLAASLGLIAFLALAGYALDRAFQQTAKDNLRQRLENYALAYADKSEFARNGEFIQPYDPIEPRFERPGSGLYAEVVLPNAHWDSHSAQGPILPSSQMLKPNEERFEGPLPMTQINGAPGEVFRYGRGFIWSAEGNEKAEFPYTIYILEDTTALSQQVAVFRAALWRYLGSAGLILMLLQTVVLRWSLRPLRNVIDELKRVQRGVLSRRSRAQLEDTARGVARAARSSRPGVRIARGSRRATATHERPGVVPAGPRGAFRPPAVRGADRNRAARRADRERIGKGLRGQGRTVRIRYSSRRAVPR
jgi:two-component system sensor histidine kinase PhoQ